ncbi:hypothetical protein DO021_09020 [Desulfobacter hydrogenophilus]|uniref:Uncharacterized protein n=1 Tax=Desulfobacter hydrogenophilus TaxID=2291 RepID=A0A328FCK2_9BACT|nr:hypothetical protein DO021_09020 [Desulfobacter hydrogenophilus]
MGSFPVSIGELFLRDCFYVNLLILNYNIAFVTKTGLVKKFANCCFLFKVTGVGEYLLLGDL